MDDRPAAAAGGIGLFDAASRNGREVQAPVQPAPAGGYAGWVASLLLASLLLASHLVLAVSILPAILRWEAAVREREAALAAAREADAKHADRMEKSRRLLIQQQAEALSLQGRILKGAEAAAKKLEAASGN